MKTTLSAIVSTAILIGCGQSTFSGAPSQASTPEAPKKTTSNQTTIEPSTAVLQPAVEPAKPLEEAAVSLNGARWELPCDTEAYNRTHGCTLTNGVVDKDVKLGGKEGEEYIVKLRFRGVVEPMMYKNGEISPIDSHYYIGGLPNHPDYNIYRLKIEKPASVFYLNRADNVSGPTFAIDYTTEVTIAANSSVNLYANIQNGSSIANSGKVTVPDVLAGAAGEYGQFVQMDVISVTLKK
ncbi:MAG: hypothetical protein EOP10_15610 [Proteobacteria bacterium]|nr:MAG: hypothetical protein EOP10_15610 [Pseudomonadota bacterium]